MKLISVILCISFLGLAYGQVVPAPKCAAECLLPECLCSSQEPPPPFTANIGSIPQIVYLTFEGAINIGNYPLYQEIFDGTRKNPNGANISATFFMNHEYNDYSYTHQLYRQGHEIALESITHKNLQAYWKTLNYTEWVAEVIDQRDQVEYFAAIPKGEIVGSRAPLLQSGGDVMYRALSENGILYDSSRPTYRYRPSLWPYTSDYESFQDCQIEPCPVESHPGFWVSPIVHLLGNNGQPCAFVDSCLEQPLDFDEAYDLLMSNFNDHYNGTEASRAPFGVYAYASWLQNPETPFIKEAYLKFVDDILKLGDVYIVSVKKGLEWVKAPVGLDAIADFEPWQQKAEPRDMCRNAFSCQFSNDQTPPDVPGERIMKACTLCPTNYPWIHNPLGD